MALKVEWQATLHQSLLVPLYGASITGITKEDLAEKAAMRLMIRECRPTEWRARGDSGERSIHSPSVSVAIRPEGDGTSTVFIGGFFDPEDAQIGANCVLSYACNCGDDNPRRGMRSLIHDPEPNCKCDEGEQSKVAALEEAARLADVSAG